MTKLKVDPITLQVIRGAMETIAEEMAHVLFRMSFSSIIRESEDLGAGLFDKDFNTLCESESTLSLALLEGSASTGQEGRVEYRTGCSNLLLSFPKGRTSA